MSNHPTIAALKDIDKQLETILPRIQELRKTYGALIEARYELYKKAGIKPKRRKSGV